jgi:hypothetical protein
MLLPGDRVWHVPRTLDRLLPRLVSRQPLQTVQGGDTIWDGNTGMRTRAIRSSRARRIAAAALLAALAPGALAVAAAAPNQAEYVSRLEAICKPNVEETQRAVQGVRSDIRRERFTIAARKLSRAGRIFDDTVGAISAVPRPPADTAQLAKWFRYLRLQKSYLAGAASALRTQHIVSYQHNSVRFVHTGNLANDVVLTYGFNYCRFKFSRFG